MLEDERIAPVVYLRLTVERLGHHRVRRMLMPRSHLVVTDGEPLLGVDARLRLIAHAGVQRRRHSRRGHRRAAGPDSGLLKLRRRPERHGLVLPPDHVPTSRVSPVLHVSLRVVRVELIEQVIPAVVVERPVWVVAPHRLRHDVVYGARAIVRHALADGVDFVGCSPGFGMEFGHGTGLRGVRVVRTVRWYSERASGRRGGEPSLSRRFVQQFALRTVPLPARAEDYPTASPFPRTPRTR